MRKDKIQRIVAHPLNGVIAAPPSKSYTHRAIICASLADGKSRITNYLKSTDIDETISAMMELSGIHINESNGTLEISGREDFNAKGLCGGGGDMIKIDVIEYSYWYPARGSSRSLAVSVLVS